MLKDCEDVVPCLGRLPYRCELLLAKHKYYTRLGLTTISSILVPLPGGAAVRSASQCAPDGALRRRLAAGAGGAAGAANALRVPRLGQQVGAGVQVQSICVVSQLL